MRHRARVSKFSAARSFRRDVSTSKAINFSPRVARGGIRL